MTSGALIDATNAIAVESQKTDQKTKGEEFSSFSSADFPVPTSKDEPWRFTPLRRLHGLHSIPADDHEYNHISYTLSAAVPEIIYDTITKDDVRIGRAGAPIDRAAASVYTHITNITAITIPHGSVTQTPIDITVVAPNNGIGFGYLLIHAQPDSRAHIVLRYQGVGTFSDIVEIIVDDHADIDVIVINDLDDSAVHLGAHHITLSAVSSIKHYLFQFGAEVERLTPIVRFRSPGASAQMYGVYCAGVGQHLQQRLLVDHAVDHCYSRVLYKGALHGETDSSTPQAHTAWVGDVLIRPNAIGTDTYEVNHNILLAKGPHADSVPNLEIETGDIISAGHATTVGRFDAEQLFYMLSRGISEIEAKKLIIRGFFHEIISKIPIKTICDDLYNRLDRELTQAGA